MAVLIEQTHETEYLLNHARILYEQVITAASASNSAASFPAASVLTNQTFERWKPSASGAVLTLTCAATINAISISAHTLSVCDSVKVEVNAGGWIEIDTFPVVSPGLSLNFAEQEFSQYTKYPDNEAALLLIEEREVTGVRITVTYSGDAPTIGYVSAGMVLEMPRPFYGGHSPMALHRNTRKTVTKSESGEWLGSTIIRQGRSAAYAWQHLGAAWYRRYFDPFVQAARTRPFVIAWNPLQFPGEAAYVIAENDFQPNNMGQRDWMSVSFDGKAYSDGTQPALTDAPILPLDEISTFSRAGEGAFIDRNGVIRFAPAGQPRFTHDPLTGESLGMLFEGGVTNQLTYNTDLDNAAWSKVRATIDSAVAPSPIEGVSYDRLVDTADDGTHYALHPTSHTTGLPYTMTVLALADTLGHVDMRFTSGAAFSANQGAVFDLSTGVGTATAGTPIIRSRQMADGGWECSITAEATGTGASAAAVRTHNGATASYAGTGQGVLVTAPQVIQRAYPLSPILTSGSAVARPRDVLTVPEIGKLMGQEQTWVLDFVMPPLGGPTNRFALLTRPGAVNGIGIETVRTAPAGRVNVNVRDGAGTGTFTLTTGLGVGNRCRLVAAVRDGQQYYSVNGGLITGADNKGFVQNTDQAMQIGGISDASAFDSPINRIIGKPWFEDAETVRRLSAI